MCIHCGTQFRAGHGRGEFCCSGCEYVYGLIQGEDLGRFYDLKGTSKLSPAGSSVLRPGSFPWLAPLVHAVEKGDSARLQLSLQGISCIGCVWLIERLFSEWPGAIEAKVRATAGEIEFRWQPGACDLVGFAVQLQKFGYTVGPPRSGENGAAETPESRVLVWRIGLCAAFAMNAMLFTLPSYLGMEPGGRYEGLFDQLTLLFASGAMVVGGSYFIQRAWQALSRGSLHIDLPIALGLILAYAASLGGWLLGERTILYFDFVAIFAFLMLGGRWLQQRAIERNRARLLESDVQLDGIYRLGGDGQRNFINVRQVVAGDRLVIPQGAHVPTTCRLLSQQATLGLAWINGEPEPRDFTCGRTVPSGAHNLSAEEIECEAQESWSSSLLAALLDVTETENPRNLAREKAIGVYLAAVIVIAAAGGAFWLAQGSWFAALQVAVSVLVVSCPCSLGVALPLAEEIAVSKLRRAGVFVRRQDLLVRLASVDCLMLDKTGTITVDEMQLEDPEVLESLDPHQTAVLWRLSGSSLHPVSLAVHDALVAAQVGSQRMSVESSQEGTPRELTGQGIELIDHGSIWRLGRPSWVDEIAGGLSRATALFSCDGKVLAEFHFREVVRDEASEQVKRLTADHYDVWILSGDRQAKVDAMATVLGVPPANAHGELSPEDKERIVNEYGPQRVCLLGDGANDSLAFRAAGCTGTPAIDRGLLENRSDFYFSGRSLAGLGELIRVAAQHRLAIRVALAFAIIYNLVAITICLLGLMNPLLAAILMPISSVVTLYIVWLALK